MDIIKLLNAPLGFCLEISMYIAYALWAYSIGHVTILKWAYAIVFPLSVAIIWGLFASPNPAVHLDAPIVYVIRIGLLLLAAGLLYYTGRISWAMTMAILSIISIAIEIFTQ